MMSNKINQEAAADLEVKEPITIECQNATRVCDPEDMFEMIEQCKICGRCI